MKRRHNVSRLQNHDAIFSVTWAIAILSTSNFIITNGEDPVMDYGLMMSFVLSEMVSSGRLLTFISCLNEFICLKKMKCVLQGRNRRF